VLCRQPEEPLKLLNEYEYKIPKIWFYEIKGVQDVATVEEIEIAKNLTSSRSKIFLETRAYLRQSLSTLFELDPLEIPINALPGEPPSLPSGMGNISLSHCKDAITIVWHKSKIGIDIERTDRDFNHIKFAEKYFFHTNKSNHNNYSLFLAKKLNYSENYIKNLTKELFEKKYLLKNTKGVPGGVFSKKTLKYFNSL